MPDPAFALFVFGIVAAVATVSFWPRIGLAPRLRRLLRLSERVLLEDAVKHIYTCERAGRACSLESLAGRLEVSQNPRGGPALAPDRGGPGPHRRRGADPDRRGASIGAPSRAHAPHVGALPRRPDRGAGQRVARRGRADGARAVGRGGRRARHAAGSPPLGPARRPDSHLERRHTARPGARPGSRRSRDGRWRSCTWRTSRGRSTTR